MNILSFDAYPIKQFQLTTQGFSFSSEHDIDVHCQDSNLLCYVLNRQYLMQWCQQLEPNLVLWKIGVVEFSIQNDGTSCGAFVAMVRTCIIGLELVLYYWSVVSCSWQFRISSVLPFTVKHIVSLSNCIIISWVLIIMHFIGSACRSSTKWQASRFIYSRLSPKSIDMDCLQCQFQQIHITQRHHIKWHKHWLDFLWQCWSWSHFSCENVVTKPWWWSFSVLHAKMLLHRRKGTDTHKYWPSSWAYLLAYS